MFGLELSHLFDAIAVVESDRGATSQNVYQIREIYIDDLNRIYGKNTFDHSIVTDRAKSELAMLLYWRHYATLWKRKNGGREITYEVLARIHNGGPDGMSKKSTVGYWKRVRKNIKYKKH